MQTKARATCKGGVCYCNEQHDTNELLDLNNDYSCDKPQYARQFLHTTVSVLLLADNMWLFWLNHCLISDMNMAICFITITISDFVNHIIVKNIDINKPLYSNNSCS